MDWSRMSPRQRDAARKLARGPLAEIPAASVSQVAKYFGDCMDYARGTIALDELLRITGWAPPAPKTREVTARELAAQLGVSVSTVYRRCRKGLVQAAKSATGRWVITINA